MRILHIADMGFDKGGISHVLPEEILMENGLDEIVTGLFIVRKGVELPSNMDFFCRQIDKTSIIEVLDVFRPDAVIFHSFYKSLYPRIFNVLMERKIPYFIKPHASFSKAAQKKSFLKKKTANLLLFNRFVRMSKGVIYLNDEENRNSYRSHENIYFMPNGINKAGVDINIKEKSSRDEIRILYLGRIDIYHKGLDYLVKTVEVLKEYCFKENIFVDIYGYGSKHDENWIIEAIRKKKLEGIMTFYGKVSGQYKDEALRKSDIFILTSRYEGMPMGILEALSYGLPCIVTGGTNMSREVSLNDAGWKVEIASEHMEKGLRRAVEDYRKRKIVLSQNALDLAKQYSWGNMADIYQDVYNNMGIYLKR